MKTEEGTSFELRLVAGALCLGLAATAVGPIVSGVRSLNSESVVSMMPEATVGAKLRRVPLFAVTDETGRPYMSEADDGKLRTGYFFIDPNDAEIFLKNVVRKTTATEEEGMLAVVRTVTLEEAYPYLSRGSRKSGGIPEKFQIVRDEKQAKVANAITEGNFERAFQNGVPLFYVENLALQGKEGDDPLIPIFFEKEKLDLFLKKATDAGVTNASDVQVIDLLQTVRELKAGINKRLSQVELFPTDKAITYTKSSEAAPEQ